jgi:S1/P1 Nuclease
MKISGRIQLSCTLLLAALFASVTAPAAWAWGCKGHQIVALIAEKHLNSHARAMVMQILAASAISPDLRRYCGDTGLDAFADSSTWADDERSVRPDTAGWHFIDIPRGAPKDDISQYCPPAAGCVTSAIADQMAILRNSNATAQARADALRYVIHFVGDLHQPLHTTTNDDRGGNCVPVGFFERPTEETNPAKEDYRPNLHGVWDTDIIEHFAHERTAQQIADELGNKFKAQIPAWQSQPVDIAAWAWEGHEVAENVVYGDLPNKIAVEKPREVNTCADDDHISMRMLKLHEEIGEQYEDAAESVIQVQFAKAGARLAAMLNSLWP